MEKITLRGEEVHTETVYTVRHEEHDRLCVDVVDTPRSSVAMTWAEVLTKRGMTPILTHRTRRIVVSAEEELPIEAIAS